MHIGKEQTIRIAEIVAVTAHEHYVPAAFVRLLVPLDKVKSFIVTDDFVYGSPLRAQAILKKIRQNRL
ncbi:hypothetical protein HU147_00020 [Planomicrobium chinense]|uniref:hypothetical protein n=1 Tax=Planococcus chinensis TaxID=272917 RepID=UPI001CC7F552|nr:hypothetical protein [Planococcus chinensis]MBZ5199585.1 hypothetical protein [Planococcus chinensis]MCP2034486.1 hypothetical protein [Planomicrobium sp. HSC-17F08]